MEGVPESEGEVGMEGEVEGELGVEIGVKTKTQNKHMYICSGQCTSRS